MIEKGSKRQDPVLVPSFENSEALVSVFGYWPSFHDAEVLRVVLDRSGDEGPTLEAVIHVFEMTNDVDWKGHFVLTHHTEVTLRFTEVALTRLQWFNQQNVLFELNVNELDPADHGGKKYRVEMSSSFGMDAEFDCKRAIVTNVRPFDSPG